MKKIYIISSFVALTSFTNAQEISVDPASQLTPKQQQARIKINERLKAISDEFSNLPEEQRKQYIGSLTEASQLFKNKRIFETLELIRQIELIFDKNPQALNLKGACQVELRNFIAARETFGKAMEFIGPTSNILFNMAEIDFVTDQWAKSLEKFTEVIKLANPSQTNLIHLVNFKILLCHIKLSELKSIPQAKREEHKKLVSEYASKVDHLTDSPYYYYANAAKYYYLGEQTKADVLLASGRRVFSNSPQLIASWEDTLIEFGYIKSYLSDDEKSDTLPTP